MHASLAAQQATAAAAAASSSSSAADKGKAKVEAKDDKKGAAARKTPGAAGAGAAADKKGAPPKGKPGAAGGAAAGAGGAAGGTGTDEPMTAAERDLAAQRARSSKLQQLFLPGACMTLLSVARFSAAACTVSDSLRPVLCLLAANSVKMTPPGQIGTLLKCKAHAHDFQLSRAGR